MTASYFNRVNNFGRIYRNVKDAYNADAASLAYTRMLDFLGKWLKKEQLEPP